jgi:hypothetical protein
MENIVITHKITDAKAYSSNELKNVIKQVVFVIEATDGVNTKTSFFPVEFDDPDTKTFVEYQELTKQQIYEWALSKVDPAQIKALEDGLTGVLREMALNREFSLQPINLPD